MEKDVRQSGGPEQVAGSREPQRASRPAPGKVTRTSRLSSSRGPAGQRKAAVSASGAGGPQARSAWDHTMDPWMDAAHRGVTALVDRDQAEPNQAKGGGGTPEAPAQLPGHGGGAEMPEDVRGKMEAAFGADFSQVRIHEGPHAEGIGAQAYTQGTSIHFAPGQYQPESQRGQELLGHELAHVVQQSQGRVPATTQAKGVDINNDAALEREADEMGARAARGEGAREASLDPPGGPQTRIEHGERRASKPRQPAGHRAPVQRQEQQETTGGECDAANVNRLVQQYRDMIREARRQGRNVAADNLQHWLDGSNTPRVLSVTWLRSFSTIISAERTESATVRRLAQEPR